ncbi:MAG: Unknown protein [uncultured Thiotrichaceae bacterium]|uniref:Chorismate-utilising enzyme C-terminal domain-containing protein n=1 Tax=uncultured Thiotrichaceae bacterium TaxID=298394 RepID=A0A6S6UD72_9GAMM|nr:MAG: Unknown protein [uncultured Thiotrichaceae bacterium]
MKNQISPIQIILKRAIDFLSFIRAQGAQQYYLVHHRHNDEIVLGLYPSNCFVVSATTVFSGMENVHCYSGYITVDGMFETINRFRSDDSPWFVLVSPDISRSKQDETLPYAICMQPTVEVVFSATAQCGVLRYVGDKAKGEKVQWLLDGFNAQYCSQPPEYDDQSGGICQFSDIIQDWSPGESDAAFLSRLKQAVRDLSAYPSAKMVLTRGYQLEQVAEDTLALFRLYALLNDSYAAAHFLQLGPEFQSLGCSPENVFQLSGREITLDVVASTRGVGNDPIQNRAMEQELTTDFKERREHLLALDRYMASLGTICAPNSIRKTQHMAVRRLRHVMHLHSIIKACLKPDISCFDIMRGGYPPLVSYPGELIELADHDPEPHRFYAGFVAHGFADQAACYLNLRSLLAHQNTLYAKAGVGVVREAKPEHELKEVQLKLSGVLEAVALWRQVEKHKQSTDDKIDSTNERRPYAC